MPTPTVSDANGIGAHGDGGLDLRTAVALMPTPKASDGEKGGPNQRGSKGDLALPSAAVQNATNWGPYEAAIRRWERIFGHPAPAPTELSTKGTHRLSARFAEWMMGIPSGWVTGVPGVSRNNQLKAIGNGVCTQQAEAALEDMLAAFETRGRVAALPPEADRERRATRRQVDDARRAKQREQRETQQKGRKPWPGSK